MSPQKFTAACVQLNCGNDMPANLSRAEKLIQQAAKNGAQFVALPENSFFMRGETDQNPDSQIMVSAMRKLSGELKIWLLFCVLVKLENGKFLNRSILLNAEGAVVTHYDKIHLFDVDVPGGESHRESDSIDAGKELVIGSLPWAQLGMSICYDLRFPQLFRQLAQNGAGIISVPSAFTYKTGEAHWQVLLQARAIETSSYIIAPAQCGQHPRNRRTYGHSIIIDPWGEILAEASEDKEEVIMAEIDMMLVNDIRAKLPGWNFA